MSILTIDFVHDFSCPWCRIGKANLERALDTWQGGPVEIRFHPYLLNPGIPPEGLDFQSHLKGKFGVEDLTPLFNRVSGAAREAGLMCDWNRISKAPNTIDAHRLIAMTPAGKQSALATTLYEAYFLHGENIGNRATLARLAVKHGWDEEEALRRLNSDELHEETRQTAAAAVQGGITGVPFFVFNHAVALSGAQPPDAIISAMEASMSLVG